MSCNYAENLSHYENKGKLGLPEILNSKDEFEEKCIELAEYFKNSNHTVVHTGAGVSTSAGIPDFRGPNGVWTLEKKGEKPSINVSWDAAKPTKTHMALLALLKAGYVSYIITQNIDGLHLRSGMPRNHLSVLHGDLFVDECDKCLRQYVRQEAVETVGLKSQGVCCPGRRANGRRCRGKLHDTILDWEDSLPDADLDLARMHSCSADLSLCLGTTLQIVPSGILPVHTKKRGGKLVICNLQPTKQDRHADLIIHYYVDDIMTRVLDILKIPIPEYDGAKDPVFVTRKLLTDLGYPLHSPKDNIPQLPEEFEPIDWTILEEWTKDKDLIQKSKSRKIIKASKRQSPTKMDYSCKVSNKRPKNGTIDKVIETDCNFKCENTDEHKSTIKVLKSDGKCENTTTHTHSKTETKPLEPDIKSETTDQDSKIKEEVLV